jgi:hypothetical protein
MATARTVNDVIESSLRLIGVLDPNQTAAAEDVADSLMAFQDLMSEIGGDGTMIPGTTTEAITLVSTQSSYTVGENGSPDLNTIRPEHIFNAFVRDSSGYDHYVDVISESDYNAISSKTTASRPQRIWYNPTAPNGTVYVHPVPTSAESLYIVSRKPFTESTSKTQELLDDLGIPRNYHSHLKFMLAVEIAPEFGVEPSDKVIMRAAQGESKIMNLNMARRVSGVNLGLPQTRHQSRDSILDY